MRMPLGLGRQGDQSLMWGAPGVWVPRGLLVLGPGCPKASLQLVLDPMGQSSQGTPRLVPGFGVTACSTCSAWPGCPEVLQPAHTPRGWCLFWGALRWVPDAAFPLGFPVEPWVPVP